MKYKVRVKKRIILIRHAHRDKNQGSQADNGLSAKGRKQTEKIFRFLRKEIGKSPCVLISSPKKRCVETLQPFADWRKIPIQRSQLLNEGGNADQFHRWWDFSGEQTVVLCIHGDWIPGLALKKGQWATFKKKIKLGPPPEARA